MVKREIPTRGPAIFTAVISVLSLDFFFVPPYYRLSVADPSYAFTLVVFLVIALLLAPMPASKVSAENSGQAGTWVQVSRLYDPTHVIEVELIAVFPE